MDGDRRSIRIDKWLWYARFFKTRSLSAKTVTGGHMRVNSEKIVKASHSVGPGDVLTFAQAKNVRVIRILSIGTRRGPAPEAQALYEDLSPPQPKAQQDPVPQNPRFEGKGRPTKKDRRARDPFRNDGLA